MFKVVIIFKSKIVTELFDDYLSAICMFQKAKNDSDFVEGHIHYLDVDAEEMIV